MYVCDLVCLWRGRLRMTTPLYIFCSLLGISILPSFLAVGYSDARSSWRFVSFVRFFCGIFSFFFYRFFSFFFFFFFFFVASGVAVQYVGHFMITYVTLSLFMVTSFCVCSCSNGRGLASRFLQLLVLLLFVSPLLLLRWSQVRSFLLCLCLSLFFFLPVSSSVIWSFSSFCHFLILLPLRCCCCLLGRFFSPFGERGVGCCVFSFGGGSDGSSLHFFFFFFFYSR